VGRTLKLGKGNPRQPDKGGALVEITCETDFVARTPELEELATRLAKRVAKTSRDPKVQPIQRGGGTMTIEHISDTARWVAFYRAMETERPDAIFRDPFARRLAGAQGERIVDSMKRGRDTAWAMIVRTAIMDELVQRGVRDEGVDLVVNLAAGLDARPWRMDLPTELRWVDVDLPGILDYKLDILSDERPKCAYEAIRADLTDADARRRVLETVGEEHRNALVLTEGLLVYLTEEQVTALASDLAEVPAFRSWIIDLASPWLIRWMNRMWGRSAQDGGARFQFAPEEGTAFFESLGWREKAFYSQAEEGRRLGREMRGAWIWRFMRPFMSRERREKARRISGVVHLERTGG
jgi:methyltransferase (TIGR00027 family)